MRKRHSRERNSDTSEINMARGQMEKRALIRERERRTIQKEREGRGINNTAEA